MNDNNLNSNTTNNNTYKATSNLNTAIENPQINVNSATGVNMQDLGYNNYANNNVPLNNNSQFLNNSYNNQEEVNNYNNNFSNNNVSDSNQRQIQSESEGSFTYEPVLQEKKIKKENVMSGILHSKEFKAIIFIVFILCIFLLVMPYIYDFFSNLKNIIFT